MEAENTGPAERIVQSLLTHTDHLYLGRPGVVIQDARKNVGVRWEPVTHKAAEDGRRVVYRVEKVGKKTHRTEIGVMNGDSRVMSAAGREIGIYRKSGLFKEVAVWLYGQIAEVWKLDNEFAARWASYAFRQDHRDLKVVLAAFMLAQARKGDPVMDGGELLFHDEDYRDVGEAMMLIQEKNKDFSAKMLLRVGEVLALPEVAAINRELGFGKSNRHAFMGRWPRAVEKWLRYREENPKMLEGLVRAGFRTTVMELARRVGYKPLSDQFFEALRWKQKQSDDGRREMAIGKKVKDAESWEGMNEAQICETIVKNKPNWKRIVGLLPKKIGVTRAIMAAAIEAGSLSNKDLIILTPTIEELGLLKVQDVKERVDAAIAAAEDMRAANIARNVRSKELKEKLEEGADKAVQKAVEKATRNMRIYFIVDRSASMEGALENAKPLIAKFIQAFPADVIHVSVFNTVGKEVTIQHASTKGVEVAFRGVRAGGGTNYSQGVAALKHRKPKDDEDSIFIFIGDEGQRRHFAEAVGESGLRPMAFALLPTVSPRYGRGTAVRDTAARLQIPCFEIEEGTFADPYAIQRTISALIEATPIGDVQGRIAVPRRVTLVDQILKTDLLKKPAWAA